MAEVGLVTRAERAEYERDWALERAAELEGIEEEANALAHEAAREAAKVDALVGEGA